MPRARPEPGCRVRHAAGRRRGRGPAGRGRGRRAARGGGTGAAVLAARDALAEARPAVVLSGDHRSSRAEQLAGCSPSTPPRRRRDAADDRPARPRRLRPRGPRRRRLVRAHRRDQVHRGRPAGGACDPRDQPRHLRVRGPALVEALDQVESRSGERYLTGVFRSCAPRAAIAAHTTDDTRSALGVNDRADLMAVGRSPSGASSRSTRRRGSPSQPRGPLRSTRVTIGATHDRAGREPAGQDDDRRGLRDRSPRDRDRRDDRRPRRVLHSYRSRPRSATRRSVGPFAYLRPGSDDRPRAKVGTFVEIKSSDVGAGARFLTCPTSATPTSARARTSAPATITANYDGGEQAPHQDRKEREDRRPHSFVAPRRRRRSGVHWCGFGDHRGCPGRGPRNRPAEAEERRGLRGPRGGGPAE